jgi:hypothetical protein
MRAFSFAVKKVPFCTLDIIINHLATEQDQDEIILAWREIGIGK